MQELDGIESYLKDSPWKFDEIVLILAYEVLIAGAINHLIVAVREIRFK